MKSKKHISIFLLLLYLVVAFNYSIPVLSHYIFKDYIINEVCVQREVVENKCQGNCHLQEQLKESEEENIPSKPTIINKTRNDFLNIIPKYGSVIILERKELIYYSFQSKLIENFKSPILPPPKSII